MTTQRTASDKVRSPGRGWRRYTSSAVIGTVVAGSLLLTSSLPSLSSAAAAQATVPGGTGYWLVTANGTVYGLGGAKTYGDEAGKHLNQPIVAIVAAADGKGYWLVGKDGGVFAFGSARFENSGPGLKPAVHGTFVGMATAPTDPVPVAGPAGATGAPGATGPAGPAGATGPAGPVVMSSASAEPGAITGSTEVASTTVDLSSAGSLMAVASGTVSYTGDADEVSCQMWLDDEANGDAAGQAAVSEDNMVESLSVVGSWTALSTGSHTVALWCTQGVVSYSVNLIHVDLDVWGGPSAS